MTETADAVVLGGGPAGLSAALELAQRGASVILIDEAEELGGQYFKQRERDVLIEYGDYRPRGTELIEGVRAAGVRCLTGTLVWGTENGALFAVTMTEGVTRTITGRRIVVATGAFEKSIPFPGWTLPGVCTPGCALHLAAVDRVAVGNRVLVAGTGPFLLPAACALLDLGIEVVAVLELNHPYTPSPVQLRALRHPARVAELAGYMGRLARHGVRIRQGWRVLRAEGTSRVQRVVVGRVEGGRVAQRSEEQVDALCCAFGFRPNTDLLRLLNVESALDPMSGDPVPVTDDFGRTSNPFVYAAGEARGIGGVHTALNQGKLAAYAIARDLGMSTASPRELRTALRRAALMRDFTALTARLYPVSAGIYRAIPDETVVCRCEHVRAGEIRDAARLGWNDIHGTKGATRAGMGPCQGRECGNTVAALVSEITGEYRSEIFSARMPIKPIPIASMLKGVPAP